MQTTLLGLAVALILALVAALVGPHFVDWNRYRSDFETEASRFIGVPVRISGPIEARLLPVPSLALHSVEISSGQNTVSARAVQFELTLGPLMRGQWRVNELMVSEPRFRIALDATGNLEGLPVTADIESDRLSIDKFVIEGGRVVLADASSHSDLTLNDLSFEGEMRSLTGPLRGDGFFIAPDGPYRFRVSSGRRNDSGVRLRLSLEGVERPLQADVDGVLQFDDGRPRFEGAVAVARPAGAVLPSGRTLAREPWRLTMQARVDPRRALAEQVEFQYGPEDRSLRLSGKADVTLGEERRFKAALTGRQVDLDRLTGAAETGRRAPAASIIAATRALFEAARVPMRGQVDLDIDAVTIGGAALQNLHGTVGVDRDQWDIETIEFRAPGLTQVRMSGRLEASAKGLEFAGPTSIDSADPRALWSLLEDAGDMPRGAPVAPLQASGDLVIGDQSIVIDRLQAEIDHKRIDGRIAYAPTGAGGPARFDAVLRADELDLDRVMAVVGNAFAGAKLERPHNVSLAISAGKLSYADIQASQVEARLKLDASGLTLERFSVADLQGANLKASGLIDVSSSSPHGAVSLALNAARADGLIGIAGRFAPNVAAEIRRYGSQLSPVELRVRLELGPVQSAPASSSRGAEASDSKLTINGKLGAVRIGLAGGATGHVAALAAAKVKIDGSLEADDGKVLAALVGFDRIAAVEARPAHISIAGSGPLDGDMAIDLRLAAGGLSASANGTARQDKGEWNGRANLALSAADARVLLNASAPAALPVAAESRVAFAGHALTFDDVKGRVAGSAVDGKISLKLGSPVGVDGRIRATDVDAGKVIAALIGVPRRAAPREESPGWSTEPFVRPLFDNVEGAISFQAARAVLLPGLAVNNLNGRARFDGASLVLDEVSGSLAGGAFTANAAFRTKPEGLSARARLALVKGDLAQFTFGRSKPPANGVVSVVSEIDGSGRSPAALVGALAGNATVTLDKVEISGLDPKAIEAAIQAADRGLAPDRLSTYLGPALDAGRLAVTTATATLAISDGRVALVPIAVNADGVDLKFAGTLNLIDDNLNARVTLSGLPREDMKGRRPEVSVVLNGALPTAIRELDTADLITFVTLRAVEREAKRLEAAEREAKKRREEAAAAERARAGRDPSAPPPDPDPAVRAGQRATGTVSGGAGSERAPDLPPAVDIKPRPAKPATAAPAARPPPPPSNRSLWDFFGRP